MFKFSKQNIHIEEDIYFPWYEWVVTDHITILDITNNICNCGCAFETCDTSNHHVKLIQIVLYYKNITDCIEIKYAPNQRIKMEMGKNVLFYETCTGSWIFTPNQLICVKMKWNYVLNMINVRYKWRIVYVWRRTVSQMSKQTWTIKPRL